MLTWAVVLITLALILYTVAVWSERAAGRVKWWHAIVLTLGFISDLVATILMANLARASATPATGVRAALGGIMAVTGTLAVLLMGLQVVASIVVLVRNRDDELQRFPRVSLIIWAIWLVPYIAGAAGSMAG